MFEKVGQMAEQMATGVSRRQFLDRFGKTALVVAGVAGGFLAVASNARAAGHCCCSATFGCYRSHGKCTRGVHCECTPYCR